MKGDMLGVSLCSLLPLNVVTTLVGTERDKEKYSFSVLSWTLVSCSSLYNWLLLLLLGNFGYDIINSEGTMFFIFLRMPCGIGLFWKSCLFKRSIWPFCNFSNLDSFPPLLPKPRLFTAEILVFATSHTLCLFLRDLSCVARQELAEMKALKYIPWSFSKLFMPVAKILFDILAQWSWMQELQATATHAADIHLPALLEEAENSYCAWSLLLTCQTLGSCLC